MTTKVVCRLLDARNQLLGWTEVQAVARGDGKLWSPGRVSIPVERAGDALSVSLHWADVNVETRVGMLATVTPGQLVTVYPKASPIITVGEMPGPLPAVTVRSVAISLPVGQLGARG